MKKKWLGITLALLVVVVAAVAAVITLGDTKAEAADYPIVITTSKTEFMAGEGITVGISGLTESMRGHILDFRLEKGFVYEEDGSAFSNRNNYKAISYLNIGKDARDEMAEPYANTSETRTVTFSDGMRVHPTRETDGYATIVPGTYTLWVLDFTTNKVVSNRIYLTVCATMISSNKTQYAYGEPIVVSHTGLPKEYFWGDGNNGDSELLIYAENDWYRAAKSESYNSCLVVGTGSGSQMYVELGKGNGSNGFTAEDYASGSVPAGSFTFPNAVDGGKFSSMIQVMPGKYRIVATYRTAAGSYLTNASNVIEIEVLAPEISISKTDLGYGEDATVTWSNVHESLRGTGYVEIGIFKKGDVVGTDRNLKYFAVHNASVNKGLNGSFSLNNDMVGAVLTATASIQPGEYFLALRTSYKAVGSNNTCTVGTAIVNFTVHSPEIQLAKDTFAYGEGITLTYKYCTEQWLLDNKNQSYLSIDVFHKGYGQAANADKGIAARQTEQEHVIFHVTPTVTQSNLTEATITFPYDDNDKKAQRFPFEPGEYRVIVRLGGKQLNETEYTFTVEEPVFKIQPELNDSISMHFSVLMGDDIFGIDTLVRNPMLKISFNNDVVENRNYTKELDSETGLYWYTFTYDNVLPQQMMDFFAAELFIEGPVFDYTKFANANSVSVRKISNYSIRTYADNALENPDYADAHDLIVAMLNYGAEAQKYFDYNAENLANAGLEKEIVNAPITDATSVVAVNGACAEGYAWKAVTLDLQSKLGFRLKFTAADLSKVTISCNGVSYTAETHVDQFASAGKDMYYFYLEGITANAFNTPYEISLTVDGMTSTVTYSVNSYIDYISTKDNTELTGICTAIYNYGLLAANYR